MDRLAQKTVTVLGGSGFVGMRLVQELARAGHRVRVAVRRPDLALPVKTFGVVGQIQTVQANLRYPHSVQHAVRDADAVINLVGIGAQAGAQSFRAVHVDGAKTIAEAAKAAGVPVLVHMSALGVDRAADVSAYAASKLGGEQATLQAFPEAVILRPSIIFGPDDGFFNLMGTLSRMLPFMPLIHGKTRFQPVYVGDVARAFVMAMDGHVKTGRAYELGGPEVVTHRELIERVLHETQRKKALVPMPIGATKMMASVMSVMPGQPLITKDQINLLGVDNVVSDAAIKEKRDFTAFDIAPVPMSAILPTYMWRFRKRGQFDRHVSEGTTV